MSERGIAENNGPFMVKRVDGVWWDVLIADIPERRQPYLAVPDEWVTRILPDDES